SCGGRTISGQPAKGSVGAWFNEIRWVQCWLNGVWPSVRDPNETVSWVVRLVLRPSRHRGRSFGISLGRDSSTHLVRSSTGLHVPSSVSTHGARSWRPVVSVHADPTPSE